MMRANVLLSVGLLLCSGVAVAQPAAPICSPIPHQGSPNFQYLSGGTMKRIHSWVDPEDSDHVRLWVAEDGGRIRFSDDGGASWEMQDTPLEAAQMLIDVNFLSNGTTGFAAGRGGRILKTVDAGANWSHLNPANPTEIAKDGNPAVAWGIHFFDDLPQVGVKAGLWDFKYTSNSGVTWTDTDLYTDMTFTTAVDSGDFEFYFLSIRGTISGGWVGLAGANWETNTPDGLKHGVIFYTNSALPQFNAGRKWAMTFNQPEAVVNDPWDFDDDGLGNGYMVGGTGTGNGSIWKTLNGGLTWTEEHEDASSTKSFATLYGVTDLGGGDAIAVGYAGNIWRRDPSMGTWHDSFVSGYTAPLFDAEGLLGTTDAWVSGSFGFLRATTNGGVSWSSVNHGEWLLRAQDLDFIDRNNGLVVGQPAQIFRTADGGCTFAKVWPSSGFGSGLAINSVTMKNATVGVAVGTDGQVLTTSDGGLSWTPATAGLTASMKLHHVEFRSGSEFWAVGRDASTNEALVLMSANDGVTWTNAGAISGGTGVNLNSLVFITGGKALLVGNSGGNPKAWLYDPALGTPFVDRSPMPDPTGAPRGLLDISAGIVNSVRVTYAVGQSGTLLLWDGSASAFVGVAGIYQFNPGTGAVTLQSTDHDYSAVRISSALNQVLVGSFYDEDLAFSQQTGYVLRFDGTSWGEVKSLTNHHARAFEFVDSTEGVVGFLLSGNGPGGSIHGTLADSDLILYKPNP